MSGYERPGEATWVCSDDVASSGRSKSAGDRFKGDVCCTETCIGMVCYSDLTVALRRIRCYRILTRGCATVRIWWRVWRMKGLTELWSDSKLEAETV